MMGARELIAMTITFGKSNKNSLEHQAYRSSRKKKTLYLQNMVGACFKVYFPL
jgi:hypothetical protein